MQEAPLHETQQDQQAPDSSIAIKKRMYRLELVVDEGRFDQRVDAVLLVDELFQCRHTGNHVLDIGRNIAGVTQ